MRKRESSPRTQVRTLGIVGYGAFGALIQTLVQRFAPQVQVKVFSSRAKPDGKTFFTLEEVAQCDAVVLTVPIHAFEETLKRVIPLCGQDTIIVDVATVKEMTGKLLKKHAPGKYIATHPMWGPESYKKKGGDIAGFRIVVTDKNIPISLYTKVKKYLVHLGFDVVEMSAKEHDTHLAETLFLTHFIGQVISDAKFDRTKIDTVSFGYLMDAVESVRHDRELFHDVFRYVPHCKKVLAQLNLSLTNVTQLLD